MVRHFLPYFKEEGRLIEPFVGAGSVFLNTDFDRYLLCDINADLINLYNTIKGEGKAFIEEARSYFTPKTNVKNFYYATRAQFNASSCTHERSLLFLYLNRHGFNGLCRYSRNGFNVPFGSNKAPYFPEKELLHFCKKAKRARFVCADFTKVMKTAKAGDTVYCDPPYVPLSKTSHFTQYSGQVFSLEDQQALAALAEQLKKRSVSVLISNHDTKLTRELYQGANETQFIAASRHISRDASTRRPTQEILAIYRPARKKTLKKVTEQPAKKRRKRSAAI